MNENSGSGATKLLSRIYSYSPKTLITGDLYLRIKISNQNFYCKSINYKGAIKISPSDFWKSTLFKAIFATPKTRLLEGGKQHEGWFGCLISKPSRLIGGIKAKFR